jgi:hypothetical protein
MCARIGREYVMGSVTCGPGASERFVGSAPKEKAVSTGHPICSHRAELFVEAGPANTLLEAVHQLRFGFTVTLQ